MTDRSHPELPGALADPGVPLADRAEAWPVESSSRPYETSFISVHEDVVRGRDGSTFTRAAVEHDDAVGIMAMDEQERLLLLHQYRHPVRHRLLQPPAGLLDVPGEDPLAAARRELFEEGHVRAADWRWLVDAYSSPGFTTERWRVFLARDLRPVAEADRHVGQHEEADMEIVWAPLDEVVEQIFVGRISDGLLVMGALACWAARHREGYAALRPA
ncbi:MAG: NUDIX domain-containing protein [Propionibacteriales bacterium]|nr:NUDIX domain-containing protein [Propionibacteriales bacterium]